MVIRRASLQYLSTGYSLRYPQPPWICIASPVALTASSEALSFAMEASFVYCLPLSLSWAARCISSRVASISTDISTSLCSIAWKVPIGRPNCSRDRILFEIPTAAMDLYRLPGCADCQFRSLEFCHGGLFCVLSAAVPELGGTVYQQPCGFDFNRHLYQFMLNRLEGADRAAELLPRSDTL